MARKFELEVVYQGQSKTFKVEHTDEEIDVPEDAVDFFLQGADVFVTEVK